MRAFVMTLGAVLVAGGLGCGSTPAGESDPPAPATATGGRSGTGGRPGTGGSSTSGSTGSGGSATTPSGSGGGAGAPAASGGTSGTGGAASGTTDAAAPSETGTQAEAGGETGPSAGAGGLGGLGPGSPDNSPPLVLPGSRLIFDGKTLTGWSCDASRWTVKDGAINGKGNGNNFCLTEGDYDTFRLTGKSRMVQSPQNHAGICWWGGRSQGGGGCLQMTPASGSLWDYGGGGGLRTFPRVYDYTKWNFFEMVVNMKTGLIQVAINGKAVPNYTDKALGRRKKGPIGLQLHAGFSELEYKDLSLEENPKEEKLLTITTGM